MSFSRLIVNADDCNLTPGVTRGILRAHDRGIVTSTTLLMNLPLSLDTVRHLKKRKGLGLGVHLNVTFGLPLSRHSEISSLLKKEGSFLRPLDYLQKMPSVKHVAKEYEAQIRLFEKRFSRPPDHLDTHHQLHDHPVFFQALFEAAQKWKIPVRRSCLFRQKSFSPFSRRMKTTDYLFGSLEAQSGWRMDSLLGVVENLPGGTAEIGCHPGYCDSELQKISSMREMRRVELNLFSDKSICNRLAGLGIELIRFADI